MATSKKHTFTSREDFDQKAEQLFIAAGKWQSGFQRFIEETVYFFHDTEGANFNKECLNWLLKIAQRAGGYSVSRLSLYLKEIIPHKLEEPDGLVPYFTTKKKTQRYKLESELVDFFKDNPRWDKYGKESKSGDHIQTTDQKLNKIKGQLYKLIAAYRDSEHDAVTAQFISAGIEQLNHAINLREAHAKKVEELALKAAQDLKDAHIVVEEVEEYLAITAA